MTSEVKSTAEERPHHNPALKFKVDCEEMEVHTTHLTVREILDLAGADPSHHYLVALGNPENIPYTNLDESISLKEREEFITVFTGETPVS